MKKVTGIGGIFFKTPDSKATKAWYQQHLGLPTNDWGATFEWRDAEDPSKKGSTQWSPFASASKYFPGEYMINYRVENIEELVAELKKEGVTIVDEIEGSDYGKFVHILDGDGNKVELWEPVD